MRLQARFNPMCPPSLPHLAVSPAIVALLHREGLGRHVQRAMCGARVLCSGLADAHNSHSPAEQAVSRV